MSEDGTITGGNYERLAADWRSRFVSWDHEAMMRRVGLAGCLPDRLEIPYYGVVYRLDRASGAITRRDTPGSPVSVSIQMALLTMLCYAKDDPHNSGEWVPFRSVPGASPFAPAFQREVLEPFAAAFSGRAEELRSIGVKLGFHPLRRSDVGFLAYAFPFIPVQFLFWDGDEEFPAQANILFDRNIVQFTHVESVVTLAEDGADLFLGELGREPV